MRREPFRVERRERGRGRVRSIVAGVRRLRVGGREELLRERKEGKSGGGRERGGHWGAAGGGECF